MTIRSAARILCTDLSFAWPDGTRVIDGLSWATGAGCTGLIGLNGSGKSTLAQLGLGHIGLDRTVGEVSGGEAVLLHLAALLLARPGILLLDEPTNNLDLASVRRLTQALAAYQGTLIVASHDLPFLRQIGITRWLDLNGDTTAPTSPGESC